MKIKIGDYTFDSDVEPVMLILNSDEKDLISNMGDQTKLCMFPYALGPNIATKFMNSAAWYVKSTELKFRRFRFW